MRGMEEGDSPQIQVICSLLFFEQFSLYEMDKEGNAFGVKKLGHLIVFTQHEAEYFRFMFFKNNDSAV